VEICRFTGKPCPGRIVTTEGERSTWSLINRLCVKGKNSASINTGLLRDDYVFRKLFPKTIAQIFSEKEFGLIFHRHSCEGCTAEIEKVLDKVGLIPDEDYLPPVES
jgi:hypothetical protein